MLSALKFHGILVVSLPCTVGKAAAAASISRPADAGSPPSKLAACFPIISPYVKYVCKKSRQRRHNRQFYAHQCAVMLFAATYRKAAGHRTKMAHSSQALQCLTKWQQQVPAILKRLLLPLLSGKAFYIRQIIVKASRPIICYSVYWRAACICRTVSLQR